MIRVRPPRHTGRVLTTIGSIAARGMVPLAVVACAGLVCGIFVQCAHPQPSLRCARTIDPYACEAARDRAPADSRPWEWSCGTDSECDAQEDAYAAAHAVSI